MMGLAAVVATAVCAQDPWVKTRHVKVQSLGPIPGRWVFEVRPTASKAERAALDQLLAGHSAGCASFAGPLGFEVCSADLPDGLADAVRHSAAVGEFSPEDALQIMSVPAGAEGGERCPLESRGTWGLRRLTSIGTGASARRYDSRWGEGVDAYILDTGVDCSHSELEGRCEFGGVFQPRASRYDMFGHGTHVAGTVAGRTFGVAPSARVVDVKVIDDSGWGSVMGIVQGMAYAQQRALRMRRRSVINMSLGVEGATILNKAADAVVASGVMVVVAAGNSYFSDSCRYSPAGSRLALTVGSTEEGDSLSRFTNVGTCIDIFAPGSGVVSAKVGGGSAVKSGTSMAAPHVAGAVAVYLTHNPQATTAEVRSHLEATALRGVLRSQYSLRGAPNLMLHIPCGTVLTPPAPSHAPVVSPLRTCEDLSAGGQQSGRVVGFDCDKEWCCFSFSCGSSSVTLQWEYFNYYGYRDLEGANLWSLGVGAEMNMGSLANATHLWSRRSTINSPPDETHEGRLLMTFRSDGLTGPGIAFRWRCNTPPTEAPRELFTCRDWGAHNCANYKIKPFAGHIVCGETWRDCTEPLCCLEDSTTAAPAFTCEEWGAASCSSGQLRAHADRIQCGSTPAGCFESLCCESRPDPTAVGQATCGGWVRRGGSCYPLAPRSDADDIVCGDTDFHCTEGLCCRAEA